MSKSTLPKVATLDELPASILQNIASRLRPNAQSTLRTVSKSVRQSVVDPFEKERASIKKLVDVFKVAQLHPHTPQPKPGSKLEGTFGIYTLDDDKKVLWNIVLTYNNMIFEDWKQLTVIKFRHDKKEIEGAIRMDFTGHRNRLQSYKAADKIWLIAFLFTLMEWMSDYEKYKAYIKHPAFMRTEKMYYFEFGVGMVELPPVWKSDLDRQHIMKVARLIWTRKRHEDKDFAELMKQTIRVQYSNKPPKTPRVTQATRAAVDQTESAYDEGRAITMSMRAASKKRDAFLNEGMLGHKAAVNTFLSKKGTRKTH